jgi:transposase
MERPLFPGSGINLIIIFIASCIMDLAHNSVTIFIKEAICMLDYREILRLIDLGYNISQIARSTSHVRSTVRDVKSRASSRNLSWSECENLTNQQLYERLYPERTKKVSVWVEPDCAWIHKELARKGVNMTLLWTEYKAKCADCGGVPYSYAQFCRIYRSWALKTKATMRINHKPGDAMEVDWAGGTLPIKDSYTGDTTLVHLFVAVLPCSCYAYAELCEDMSSENWLMAHVHAYEYFGGVPRLLIPDNLKTGVTANTRFETLINKSYQDLADHYGTAVVPTRVRKPRDKSHAEGTVSFATTWILAALRNETFFSFEEARAAVSEKLEILNTVPFKKRKGNRREAYLMEEKNFLQPLPVNPFEPSVWREQKVLFDYTVSDGLNKYSVPYDLIGEVVGVRVTSKKVEVYYAGNRVAIHVRDPHRRRMPIMKESHMPETHRKYLEYTPEDFRSWAKSIGKSTSSVVNYFLQAGKAPEQGFKSCISLRKLAERYTGAKVEKACRSMLSISSKPTIREISILLKTPQAGTHKTKDTSAKHTGRGITRGAAQFQKGGNRK